MKAPLFDYAAAQGAKLDGMARAEENASPRWSASMYQLVIETARTRRRFTADDVFELAMMRNIPDTHELRAFGPIMMQAARNGVCRKADCAPVPSRRRSLHGSPRAVWESLICEAGKQ